MISELICHLVYSSFFRFDALEFSLCYFELNYAFKRMFVGFYPEFLHVLLQERFSDVLSNTLKETGGVLGFQFNLFKKSLYR